MQAIHADNVTWKTKSRGVREAVVFRASSGSDETRIDMVEVPAGGYIPPHRHSSRREFITILLSAGAQLQIGERIFRPIAGQVFHREPGDVLALTNDSHHPFRYSVVRFGYEASDIEWLREDDVPEDFGHSTLDAVTVIATSTDRVEVETGAAAMEVDSGHPDREAFQSGEGMTAAHGESTDAPQEPSRSFEVQEEADTDEEGDDDTEDIEESVEVSIEEDVEESVEVSVETEPDGDEPKPKKGKKSTKSSKSKSSGKSSKSKKSKKK